MNLKIDDVVSQNVTIDLNNHEDNCCPVRGLSAKLNGKLEYDDADDPKKNAFFLRVKECYEGTSGMTFPRSKIKRVERMPSGRIVVEL